MNKQKFLLIVGIIVVFLSLVGISFYLFKERSPEPKEQDSIETTLLQNLKQQIEKNKDYSIDDCQSPEYQQNPSAKEYCLKTLDITRCEKETTDFSKNYCILETAKAKKDKTICDKITNNDKYMCYAVVAEATQDPELCYEIPEEIKNSFDVKFNCYKKIKAFDPGENESIRSAEAVVFINKERSIIERACMGEFTSGTKENIVSECENGYYSVFTQMMDAPTYYINDRGENVGTCGGMPHPGRDEEIYNRFCGLSCGKENLCQNISFDCSLYNIPKEIPKEYDAQVKHFLKQIIYEYRGTTAEREVAQCERIFSKE